MGAIHELGHALRERRIEMGLSQAHLAALSHLSRQTVNQIEAGAAPDLGINKAERLASVLGLKLHVEGGRQPLKAGRKMMPLTRAAASASVSYKIPIEVAALKKVLTTGQMSAKYRPHVHALLDDAPVSLLADVAKQLDEEANLGRDTVWKNFRHLAREVKSKRDIWQ
jgi:transcriptional regulator with XRE-family HTH domain